MKSRLHRAKRSALLAAVLTITVILATPIPAQAMRDPGPGAMAGGGPATGMGLYNYASAPPRIGQAGLNAQYADGMNLYQYVRGGPTVATDPTGALGVSWTLRGGIGWDFFLRGKMKGLLALGDKYIEDAKEYRPLGEMVIFREVATKAGVSEEAMAGIDMSDPLALRLYQAILWNGEGGARVMADIHSNSKATAEATAAGSGGLPFLLNLKIKGTVELGMLAEIRFDLSDKNSGMEYCAAGTFSIHDLQVKANIPTNLGVISIHSEGRPSLVLKFDTCKGDGWELAATGVEHEDRVENQTITGNFAGPFRDLDSSKITATTDQLWDDLDLDLEYEIKCRSKR